MSHASRSPSTSLSDSLPHFEPTGADGGRLSARLSGAFAVWRLHAIERRVRATNSARMRPHVWHGAREADATAAHWAVALLGQG